jgi:hypothetical protein
MSDIDTARNELSRTDHKASTMLSLALALLAVGLTIGARGRLHLAVIIALWTAVAALVVMVIVLTAAIRPRLDGDNGIVAWARGERSDEEQALVWVSQAALRKHRLIYHSITCLWFALAAASVAAILSAVLA